MQQQITTASNDDEYLPLAPIDSLPEEVLRLIFMYLDRADLLRLTTVCHRWNQLIFQLLSGQLRLRLSGEESLRTDFGQTRVYKHIGISLERGTLDADQMRHLKGLGRQAESLDLSIKILSKAEFLLDMFRIFPLVRSLTLSMDLLFCRKRTKEVVPLLPRVEKLVVKPLGTYPRLGIGTMKKLFQNNMPSVHDLTIDCSHAKLLDLLMTFAPSLVSLSITIKRRFLKRVCGCSFPRLQSLSLTIHSGTEEKISTMNNFRLELFNEFMAKLSGLKSLYIVVHSKNFSDVIEAIYGMSSVEQLTVKLEDHAQISLRLSCFRPMTNLRVLRVITGEVKCIAESNLALDPMPQVEELYIEQMFASDGIPAIAELFPNLKILAVPAYRMDTARIQLMAAGWPNMEELSFRVVDLTMEVCHLLCRMQNLRKLSLHNCDIIEKDQFQLLDAVLAMPSLRELHINGRIGPLRISPINPRCRLFLNGRYINRA